MRYYISLIVYRSFHPYFYSFVKFHLTQLLSCNFKALLKYPAIHLLFSKIEKKENLRLSLSSCLIISLAKVEWWNHRNDIFSLLLLMLLVNSINLASKRPCSSRVPSTHAWYKCGQFENLPCCRGSVQEWITEDVNVRQERKSSTPRQPGVSMTFIPCFDVFCGLLLKRRTKS